MDLCFCFFWIGFVCGCCLLLRLFSHLSLAIRSKKRNLSWADNMNLVQHLLERLRSVISLKGWDYCVIWKLSDDQRFLEWVDCCCAGSDPIIQNGDGDGLVFPVSSVSPCRDTLVHHPKTKPCHLLAELPLSMPLDSGIYAQTLMSNQATWLNLDSNSPLQEETDGTRVLIPVPIGLVELFVAKHVPAENREITNYIAAQCNIFMEQDAAVHCSTTSTTMESAMMSEINTPPLLIHSGGAAASDSPSLPYDVYVDRIRLSEAARSKHDTNNSFFEGLNDHFEDQTIMMMMESNNNNSKEQLQQQDKGDSVKMETGRSESISDCSEEDDDEDAKHRRRTGKGPQSKNLVAERKRRKKLNDKLYALRALVPKISKLDRASILGDAIEFVKELQKQVKDLQNELEEQSGDNHDEQGGAKGAFNTSNEFLLLDQNGMATINHLGLKREDDSSKACKNMGSFNTSFGEPGRPPNHDSSSNIYDKRQMEPQVEVVPLLDGNEFFVKVFSEFKTGGFVRLMESLDFLGLEVTNVNVNRFISLVSYVFKVEKRGSEMVQADHVRDSLLEITRNPTAGREWSEKQLSSENGGGNYHVDLDHHRQHHHISSRHQFHQHQQ